MIRTTLSRFLPLCTMFRGPETFFYASRRTLAPTLLSLLSLFLTTDQFRSRVHPFGSSTGTDRGTALRGDGFVEPRLLFKLISLPASVQLTIVSSVVSRSASCSNCPFNVGLLPRFNCN